MIALLFARLTAVIELAALSAVPALSECGPTVCAHPSTRHKLIDEPGTNN